MKREEEKEGHKNRRLEREEMRITLKETTGKKGRQKEKRIKERKRSERSRR